MSNITLRDHFAGLAMQGLIVADRERDWDIRLNSVDAYRQADAMIEERNKHMKERHQELLCQGEPV